jgi:hypothetical protein
MPTGKKPKTIPPAVSRRIAKLTADLKTARRNLRAAVRKLVVQNARWEAKLKKLEALAIQKCKAVCVKKAAAKKRFLVAAETKFEKAFGKKKPAKKAKPKKAAPKRKTVAKKAKPRKAVAKKAKPKKAATKRKTTAKKAKKAKK